jgi:F-type H+-transporting ATPase subunit delta
MSVAIASRYARALADLAFSGRSASSPDEIGTQLRQFEDLLQSSPELRTVMATPAISHPAKLKVAGKLAAQLGLGETARNFLNVAIQHGRIALLRTIRESYEALVDERRGIQQVSVHSAVELTGDQAAALEQKLAARIGRQVRCTYVVDAALLGGVLVRVGSQVYDGSVRGRLAELAAQLA